MEEYVLKHLKDLYGLNSDIPHLAFQFPRLPPGINHPISKIYENPLKEKFLQNTSMLNKKLDGYQKLYQQHISGLITMNTNRIIPPGHPMYSEKNSFDYLKVENDKLKKQNLQLKKQLEKQ